MIHLHEGSGSKEIDLLEPALAANDWERLRGTIIRLLERRGHIAAADAFRKHPFILYEGTNGFCDDFHVLYLKAPLDKYVEWAEQADQHSVRDMYRTIAATVGEVAKRSVRFVAVDIDEGDYIEPVAVPGLSVTSDVVMRALRDAERLIATEGATSGVDRVHTAFHGYLQAVLERDGIPSPSGAGITELFKVLREKHPKFQGAGPRQQDVDKVLRSIASVVDALNPVRNLASIAHPNRELLDEPEAMLVINSVRTLLHYFNERTRA